MPDYEATNSQGKGQSTRCQGDENEGAHSHTMAFTSLRCGFLWHNKELDEQLAAWLELRGGVGPG